MSLLWVPYSGMGPIIASTVVGELFPDETLTRRKNSRRKATLGDFGSARLSAERWDTAIWREADSERGMRIGEERTTRKFFERRRKTEKDGE